MQTQFYFFNEESKLLDALRNGNEHALADLFHQNRKSIASLVMRNHGSEDDVEDILQEALVVLWERIHSGSFEYKAKLSTFIYATAKNIWFRRLSRQRREVSISDESWESASGESTPLEALEENERVLAVQQAMEQIGNPCHDLLLLYYWEEQSMEEIAQRLGFANADTVKSKKYQCKKTLEHMVKKALGERHE
ncbi:MAG: sigma-70 family RNA polymerase sigma factor [Ignavibacteriae bacterium]|nr:MAG: sigma-70 family RNA polymerase sigma factor [Ignavibacteriota bacterium]